MKHIKDIVKKHVNSIRISVMGTITSVIKKDKTIYAKVSEDEEFRDVTIISPYGLFSLPLINQNCQVLFNNTSKKISLIGVEHTSTPIELDTGEVLLFNANTENYIYLKNDGKVYIEAPIIIKQGTQNVARVGDTVSVNVPGVGVCTGTITNGTSNIKA